MKQNETYIDMRTLCCDLKKEAMQHDNSIIKVNELNVLLKVTPEIDVYDLKNIRRYFQISYIYDTGIESYKISKSEQEYTEYSEESYQIICEHRDAIEDALFDFVYKNKLVLK